MHTPSNLWYSHTLVGNKIVDVGVYIRGSMVTVIISDFEVFPGSGHQQCSYSCGYYSGAISLSHCDSLTMKIYRYLIFKWTAMTWQESKGNPYNVATTWHATLIQLFQNFTFKIQSQGHGWGQSWKSQSGSDFLLAHIPFVQCQSPTQPQGYRFFKIWPWKPRVKVIAQCHTVALISYQLNPIRSMLINPPILDIQLLQNLTFKIQGQGHGWGHNSKLQSRSDFLSTHIPFAPCQSVLPFLGCCFFKIWPWKNKVKVIAQPTDTYLFVPR